MERNADQGPASGVTPHLTIRGRRAHDAIRFYEEALGARVVHQVPSEDGRVMHAHLAINGGSVMLNDDFPEYMGGRETGEPQAITLHLQVQDADALWHQAVGAGAEVVVALQDQFWGDRYGVLRDPFGHRWSIGAPIQAA